MRGAPWVADDAVVCVLEDTLTAAEKTLQELGELERAARAADGLPVRARGPVQGDRRAASPAGGCAPSCPAWTPRRAWPPRCSSSSEERCRASATPPRPWRSTPWERYEEALAATATWPIAGLATAIHLARVLEQPLLLEGEAGVGKTEAAKALAAASGSRLIRLQCHEGIDAHQALYDWDYARQLLAVRAERDEELFSRRFLLARPLLEALEHPGPGRPADRRDRPRRRRVRGVPARARSPTSRSRSPSSGRSAPGAAGRRCSPRTARASCTTRSSAAASTTGSTTRRPSASGRSSPRACPASPRRSPRASSGPWPGCAETELYKVAGRGGDRRLGAGAARARRGRRPSTRRSASR